VLSKLFNKGPNFFQLKPDGTNWPSFSWWPFFCSSMFFTRSCTISHPV